MFAILAAVILDVFVKRPGPPMSITTIIPGSTYAMATVMKVCGVSGLVSVVLALLRRASPPTQTFPVWAVVSVILPTVTTLVGALVVLLAQALADKPAGLSLSDFSGISRTAVIVMLVVLSAAAVAAVTSLLKGERPRLLAVLAVSINTLLIGLFWHLEFYALGFDQDTWAPH